MDLETWRKGLGLTQVAAGERIGLSQPSLARIENGEQWPGPETLRLIETATEGCVTANDILARYQARQASEAA